jgi:hypothetical protein
MHFSLCHNSWKKTAIVSVMTLTTGGSFCRVIRVFAGSTEEWMYGFVVMENKMVHGDDRNGL